MGKSFLGSLFDFGFDSLITPKIISIIYGIAMFFIALGTLAMVLGVFSESFLAGIGMLVISPIIFLLWLIFARVYCEVIIALFKIAENTSALKSKPE